MNELEQVTLKEVLASITPVDPKVEEAAWEHWDSRCKPLRGFGVLEEWVVKLAAIRGTASPRCDKRAIVIMGADNGVVEEGVSQTDASVTIQVLENMGNQMSSVCQMSKIINADVYPVNIGSNTDGVHPRIRNYVVRHGTGNIAKGPAMTREECIQAIETGIRVVGEMKDLGYDLIITGEMGIANTTTSSACVAAIFDQPAAAVTGRGAGLSSEGMLRKIAVIDKAIALNQPDKNDPIDVMSKVGGLDIAGMTGLFLGSAYYRLPVFIDGFISSLSALFAYQLCPASRDYMFASHATAEPAGQMILKALDLKAILYAGMHLGEGTGAAAVLPLMDQALNVYYNIPGWNDSKVEAYEHLK